MTYNPLRNRSLISEPALSMTLCSTNNLTAIIAMLKPDISIVRSTEFSLSRTVFCNPKDELPDDDNGSLSYHFELAYSPVSAPRKQIVGLDTVMTASFSVNDAPQSIGHSIFWGPRCMPRNETVTFAMHGRGVFGADCLWSGWISYLLSLDPAQPSIYLSHYAQ
jgi:hypothetical protein